MWPAVWKRDRASARKCSACATLLLAGAALFGLGKCSSGVVNEELEFSLEEFYDIKRSVMRTGMDISKAKKASAVLEQAREKSKKLHGSLPKAPKFHGQDHYEQTIDDKGHETWSHVGRPVRLESLGFPLETSRIWPGARQASQTNPKKQDVLTDGL